MGERRKFQRGDKVRDLAHLGGTVIETFGNGVKISWNNMQVGWINERWLKLDEELAV